MGQADAQQLVARFTSPWLTHSHHLHFDHLYTDHLYTDHLYTDQTAPRAPCISSI